MSDIIENAKATIEECRRNLEKFNRIKAQSMIRECDAKEKLLELEKELSEKLTAVALNEAAETDVAEIKKAIAVSKEIIADAPHICEGLVAREGAERAKWQKAQKVLLRFEKYETLKEAAKEEGYNLRMADKAAANG
jgi:hypothetical protein